MLRQEIRYESITKIFNRMSHYSDFDQKSIRTEYKVLEQQTDNTFLFSFYIFLNLF